MSLPWKKYRELTQEQRSEYDYRFKETPNFAGKYVSFFIVGWSLLMSYISVTALVLFVPGFEQYKSLASDFLVSGAHFWALGVIVVGGFWLHDLGVTIWKFAQFYKWKKKEGLK